MAKKMRSFRSKMVMLFALSMIFAGGVTYIIYEGLRIYYKLVVRFEDPLAQFRSMVRQIGDVNFFLIIFIPLSIMFFFFLTRPYLKYFDEISNGIHHLANGDFTNEVRVSSNDEFGYIAREINVASEKLKEAVERGDFAESSKDQLIVNLAHDLRTPLTSVLGYLDL
ncbi:HAMP domain-containing protein, partial [Bacillus wiedmannii]